MGTIGEGPVCIIGMHRSGTSMVANLLNHCGLSLGPEEKLLGPNANNPMGHFEHAGFLKINEALLKYLGGSWDNPPSPKPGWERDLALDTLVHEAQSLLESFADYSYWGWKEPRTTILLPFWKSLIRNIRFVICVRNPLEVAQSVAARDRIPIRVGAFLWHQYMHAAIRDTEGCPAFFTFYDDYFKDSPAEFDRLVQFCGLPTPADCSRIRGAIARELRHHANETVDLLNEAAISTEDKLLYLGLRGLLPRIALPRESNSKTTNSIRVFLHLIEELSDTDKVVELRSLVAEKSQQLSILQSQLFEKDQRMAQLQQRADRLQMFADAVRETWAYRAYRLFIRPLKPQ
jgi:hypothetical protein